MEPDEKGHPRHAVQSVTSPPSPPADQMRGRIHAKRYSLCTEHAYFVWAKRFILFNSTRHPVELSTAEVERFLSHLAEKETCRPLQNQALTPNAREVLLADLEIPAVSLEDMYGGELVAAMDRQYPRDLFDVMQLPRA